MRLAPPLLRFSCGVGLSALVFSLLPGGGALADGVPAASPDDMVLDLGGATLETRRIAHGSFTQGAPATESGHDKEEEPAHHVTITKDFWMGKYPVTRGQFAKFVADTRYVSDAEKGQSGGAGWVGAMVPDGGKGPVLVQKKDFTWRNPGFTQTDEHPVVLVSYGDANAFVGWASRKSGKRVRLPTESEWEFAARGGATTSWSGGAAADSDPASYGWFKPNAGNGTRPVGQKKANPFGLFDMSGNVMEWCRDVYAPYREGALIDPEVTTNTSNEPERRVLRGGSWFRDPKRGRSAARYKNTPGSRNADNGFRVVVTNEETVTPGLTGPGPDFVPSGPLGASGSTSGAPGGSSGNGGSGPLADGEPLRLEPVGHPGDAFSWGLLLASPVAAASAVVAWMLLRRKKKKPAARASAVAGAVAAKASGISTEALSNGFVVRISDAAPGASVRFECIIKGKQVSDVVLLDASKETFVRTGSPPTAIRILEIIAAAPAVYRPSAPGAAPVSSPAPPSASGAQPSAGAPPRSVPPPLPLRRRRSQPPPPSTAPSSARPSAPPPMRPELASVIIEGASPTPAVLEPSIDESMERTEPLPPVVPRVSATPPAAPPSMERTEPLHPLAPRAPVEDATVPAPQDEPVAESAPVAPVEESVRAPSAPFEEPAPVEEPAPAPAVPIEASPVVIIGPAPIEEAPPAPGPSSVEEAPPAAIAPAAPIASSDPAPTETTAAAPVASSEEPAPPSAIEGPPSPPAAREPRSSEDAPAIAEVGEVDEEQSKPTDADAPPNNEPPPTT